MLALLCGCSPGGDPARQPPPIAWERRFDFLASSIVPAPRGEYLLVGPERGDKPAGFIVARINPRGEEISRRRHELPVGGTIAHAAPVRDGGSVIVGTTGMKQGTDILIIRLDPSGEVLWRHTFGGPSFEDVKNVVSLPDGGFVIGAATVFPSAGKLDFYLLKVSDSGELEWQETYGAEGWEGEYESAPSVTATRDGGFLLVGSTDSQSLVGDRSVEVYAVRTDSRGKKLHEWVLGDELSPVMQSLEKVSGKVERGFDVGAAGVELEDGYVLAGTRSNFRPGVFLLRVSVTGDVVWEVTRGEHHGDGCLPLVLLPGGKVVAGTSYWKNSASGVAAYLLQVGPDGDVEWELRDSDSAIGRVLDLHEAEDHGVLVLGVEQKRSGSILVKLEPE